MVIVTGINYMILFQEVSISRYNGCHLVFGAMVLNLFVDCMRIPDAWVANVYVRWSENDNLYCF
jgi:hypothetical protein